MVPLKGLAGLLVTVVTMTAAGGDFVRLTVQDPAPTPFSLIRYEVTRRGRTTMCVHRRQLPGYGEALHGMGLLTARDAEGLWDLVRATDALALPTVEAPEDLPWTATVRWKVELSVDGRNHSFEVTEPIHQSDRRYHRLVSGVRSLVERLAGPQPFRNIFFPDEVRGWLDVDAVPAAQVSIDSFDTRLETPVFGYELEAGTHEVRLRTRDGRYDRTYPIQIEPTMTTRLEVDLR